MKKELLGEIIEKTQLTPQEIIEIWVDDQKIDAAFLSKMSEKAKSFENVTFIPSKKFMTPELIKPGMYVYADGLIYPDLIPEAQLQSVVGFADKQQVLCWCLQSVKVKWSARYFYAGVDDKSLSGSEATGRIIAEGKKLNVKTPAAAYCFNYAEDGVEPGTAFLPSYSDGERLLKGISAVNEAFEAARLKKLEKYLILASEYSTYCVWILWTSTRAFQGGLTDCNKNYTGYDVRPVLALKR